MEQAYLTEIYIPQARHLHIAWQKKILLFLIRVFSNLQFIVATHFPFVVSSIESAVIYDLEKNIM